jgi:DHA2 family multidrug resistance protein
MLALGAILFGTTVLIPQYLQTVMGYTAQSAGMVLSPGGLTVMICMPIVGRLVNRVDARLLIAFGFIVLTTALLHMSSIYPGIDFRTAMFYRIYQSIGLAFLFVPINTISFVNIPPSQGNQVSAMINLCRNLGGSIGISAFSTILARSAQVHQTYLSAHTSATDLASRVAGAKEMLFRAGSALPDAAIQADGKMYQSLLQQATALAYIDVIRLFALACFLALPLLLFANRARRAAPAMAH